MASPNPIVRIGKAEFGNAKPLSLIAGPCQLESRAHALEMASSGLSLTEAAHAAAFSDSSHLTRVFRETFGLKPSAVFGSRFVQARLCSDL